MRWVRVFLLGTLTLGVAVPAVAWAQTHDEILNDSEAPGSVLVFQQFIRGTVLTPD